MRGEETEEKYGVEKVLMLRIKKKKGIHFALPDSEKGGGGGGAGEGGGEKKKINEIRSSPLGQKIGSLVCLFPQR